MARPAARRAVPAPDVDTIDDRLELGRLVGLAREQRSCNTRTVVQYQDAAAAGSSGAAGDQGCASGKFSTPYG